MILKYLIFELIRSFGANINIIDNIHNYKFIDYIDKIVKIISSRVQNIYQDEIEFLAQIIMELEISVALPSYLFGIKIDFFDNEIIPKLSEEFLCPISKTPLLDPVIASDGHTYNRKSILTHFDFSACSPVTRENFKF